MSVGVRVGWSRGVRRGRGSKWESVTGVFTIGVTESVLKDSGVSD